MNNNHYIAQAKRLYPEIKKECEKIIFKALYDKGFYVKELNDKNTKDCYGVIAETFCGENIEVLFKIYNKDEDNLTWDRNKPKIEISDA